MTFYYSLYTNGGGISSTQITSNVKDNIFPSVNNAERISGATTYRKIFYFNSTPAPVQPSVYTEVTPCKDDEVYFCLSGNLSLLDQSTLLCAGATVASTYIESPVSIRLKIAPMETIYTSINGISSPATVTAILSDYRFTYSGSLTPGIADIYIAPATMFTYALTPATAQTLYWNEYVGIWLKRIVNPNAEGYMANTFTIYVN